MRPTCLALGTREDYVQWLDNEVLAGVDGPVTLVVHDFGGPVGLSWAVRHPERVARLVIMNTSVYLDALPLGFLLRVPGFVPLLGGLMWTKPFFNWQMRSLFRLRDQDVIAEYQAIYTRPAECTTFTRVLRAWGPAELGSIAAGLRHLTCPVLLVWGLEDEYIFPWKPHGERFPRDLPHARVEKIPGAAHFLQVERPADLLCCLKSFLPRP